MAGTAAPGPDPVPATVGRHAVAARAGRGRPPPRTCHGAQRARRSAVLGAVGPSTVGGGGGWRRWTELQEPASRRRETREPPPRSGRRLGSRPQQRDSQGREAPPLRPRETRNPQGETTQPTTDSEPATPPTGGSPPRLGSSHSAPAGDSDVPSSPQTGCQSRQRAPLLRSLPLCWEAAAAPQPLETRKPPLRSQSAASHRFWSHGTPPTGVWRLGSRLARRGEGDSAASGAHPRRRGDPDGAAPSERVRYSRTNPRRPS